MRLAFVLFALAVLSLGAACSSSDFDEPGTCASGPGGGAGDGKIHPPPNGEPMTEAEACQLLIDAYEARAQSLPTTCTGTVRTCPNHVRILTGKIDATYDRGSVQGCADHYTAQVGCPELNASLDECVPATHPLQSASPSCP